MREVENLRGRAKEPVDDIDPAQDLGVTDSVARH